MNKIISDAYYMIKLHTDRFKEINISKLGKLLYLSDAKYMVEENSEEGLYKGDFYITLRKELSYEICHLMLDNEFKNYGEQNIILNEKQEEGIKDLDEKRKHHLYEVYKIFGVLNDFQLSEHLLINVSPIYNRMKMLYEMKKPIPVIIQKWETKDWYNVTY